MGVGAEPGPLFEAVSCTVDNPVLIRTILPILAAIDAEHHQEHKTMVYLLITQDVTLSCSHGVVTGNGAWTRLDIRTKRQCWFTLTTMAVKIVHSEL